MRSHRCASRLVRGALAVFAVTVWGATAAGGLLLASYGKVVASEPEVLDLRAGTEPPPPRFASVEGADLGGPLRGSRPWLPLSRMGANLPLAVLGAEDSRFFLHDGIDPVGLGRALLSNLRGDGPREGGSTLTQQLAKQQVGSERTLSRKVRELVVARRAEHQRSKPDILEAYLNRIYLGAGAVGFPAAAEIYFCKQPRDLTLAEAATLAAIIPAPSRFAPDEHAEAAKARRDRLLSRMAETGLVSRSEAAAALAEPMQVCRRGENWGGSGLLAVARSAADGRGDLVLSHSALRQQASLQALRRAGAEHAARQGGAVRARVAPGRESDFDAAVAASSTDLRLARVGTLPAGAAPAVQDRGKALPSDAVVAIDGSGQLQGDSFVEGAVLVLDRASGEPLVQVGSMNPKRDAFDRTRQACRQPGSTFKPLLFELAMEQGLTPASLLSDGPAAFELGSDELWTPRNADGAFGGALTLWKALATSRNLPFVALGQRLGLQRLADHAKRFGIASPMAAVESLPLGGSCLSPSELAQAYAVIASGGRRQQVFSPSAQLWDGLDARISSAATSTEGERVADPVAVFQTAAALREVVEVGTAHALAAAPFAAAGKTGTSTSYDAWFAGFTTDEVAVVWVGSDKNAAPLGDGERGSTLALPVWLRSVRGSPDAAALLPPAPPEVVWETVDLWSGQPHPAGRPMPFRQGTAPHALRTSEAGRVLDGIRSIERDF